MTQAEIIVGELEMIPMTNFTDTRNTLLRTILARNE